MANVRFNLKNRTESETLISVVFRYDGQKLVYSTGQKINPKFWNDKEQKARETSRFPQFSEFNAYLKKIETETQNIYRRFKIDGNDLTIETFKKHLDIALHKQDKEENIGLFKFIENFIDVRENSLGRPTGSIQVYKKSFKHLKEFAIYKKRSVDFNDINFDFLDDFLHYLFMPPRSLSSNYSLKILQNIKMFMQDALDKGLHQNITFKNRKFSIKKEDTENIYLTITELKKIAALDLTKNKRLDKVRDLFLIGCFTGLRFSDFSNLKSNHFKQIDGVNVIEIITQKTKEKVIIPVHPIVLAALNKYDGNIPPEISNQKMNEYLKELGELAEINGNVIKVRTKGGRRMEEVLKKFEMISTHTARRSFATNAFKAGISSISIMKITGHTSEQQFLKYIKITGEENAVLMSRNPFFC